MESDGFFATTSDETVVVDAAVVSLTVDETTLIEESDSVVDGLVVDVVCFITVVDVSLVDADAVGAAGRSCGSFVSSILLDVGVKLYGEEHSFGDVSFYSIDSYVTFRYSPEKPYHGTVRKSPGDACFPAAEPWFSTESVRRTILLDQGV